MAETGADGTTAGHSTEAELEKFEVEEPRTEDRTKRDEWGFNIEFIVAAVSYCAAYTNIWRLPYFMYRFGGGAFLVPYFICLLLFGVPMFYLETCLGQFWGKGPFHIWKICPILRGIGVSLIVMNFINILYTNPFLSWFIYYAAMSLSRDLPWTRCDHSWNTENCGNRSNYGIRPEKEFFLNGFLQISDGIHHQGSLRWELVACLLVATLLMFASLFRGVRLTGKILLVTVCLSLLILVVLLLRAFTLAGSGMGIQYLLLPNFHQLARSDVWVDASIQALAVSGVSPGVIHTLSSYNKFSSPCLRNTYIIMALTVAVGILNGLMIWALIGAHAFLLNVSVDEIITSGLEVTFVSGPAMFSHLPGAQFWCFIFILMNFFFGFNCQILSTEVLITTAMDILPRATHKIRAIVTAVVCAICFVLSLPFLTQAGYYMIILFDWYAYQICLFLFCVLQCITVVVFYGLNQFSEDIKMMTGMRPPVIFKFIWAFIIPLLSLLLLVVTMIDYIPIRFENYIYPVYINSVGHFLSTVPLYAIPIFIIIWFGSSSRQYLPLAPAPDLRPATDRWMEYETKQRQMERTVCGNLAAVFKI